MVRKRYTPAQKAAIVLELLKEADTLQTRRRAAHWSRRIASRHSGWPIVAKTWPGPAGWLTPKPTL
jgi:hypothetical protein